MSAAGPLRPFERRVTASYLAAFAVVLGVFVVAVHIAFAADLAHETSARLSALLDEGTTALEVKHGRVKIDSDALQVIAPASESVTWTDARGRLVSRIGMLDPASSGDVARATEAVPHFRVDDPHAPARVEAALDLRANRRALRRVDLGLAIGLLTALVAAGVGGRILAARALERVAATIRTQREFTADAAHELRGPLAALASNAAASLRDAGELSAAHRRRLETIEAAARSMTRTIDDLLLLARAETPIERDLFAIELSERVAAVVEARRALAAERGIDLAAETCRARIYGNPAEVERIIGNLLDNALRYTEPGGHVRVECVAERAGVSVRVRDTGIGIAAEDLSRIFERFWRGDAVRGHDTGTGLGLAIVRALTRRHGGDVTVCSTPGSGSEFAVWFPLRPPAFALDELSTFG